MVCFQTWVRQCFPVRSKQGVKEELSVLIFKGQLRQVFLHQIQLILQEPIGRQAGKANEKQLTDSFDNLCGWVHGLRLAGHVSDTQPLNIITSHIVPASAY